MPLQPFEDVIAAGRQGSVAVVTGLQSRGRPTEALFVEGIHSFVAVPLLFQGELIGSINFSLGAADLSASTRECEDVARQVADQLAIAIQQARLYEQVQRHAEELEQRLAARTRELAAFFDLATLTARGRALSEILAPALTRIMDVAHCQTICVHLLDEEGSTLRLVSQRNLPDEARQRLGVMTVGDDFLRRISQVGDPITATDLARSSLMPDLLRLEGFQSYLGVSLRAGEHPLGWLSYYRASDGGFALDETALLTALAQQIGVVVENHNLRLRMEEAAVMEERGRLARELHDSVTQSLYSMVLLTEGGRRLAASGDMARSQEYFADLEGIALQALKEMRLLVYELRPSVLEGEGLVGALQQRLDAVEGRANMEARLLVEGAIELPAAVEAALYGIAQEALNNALKHASATAVTVRLRSGEGGRVELEIADDGRGFDTQEVGSQGGMGLATMRDRAEQVGGRLEMLSAVGKGTRVRVIVG